MKGATRLDWPQLDHTSLWKREDGGVVLLSMPYATVESLQRDYLPHDAAGFGVRIDSNSGYGGAVRLVVAAPG